MASRVLLFSPNRFTLPDPVFPLGLAYLNAALRRAGHDVRWVDSQIDHQPLEEIVSDYQPDFIGISLRNIDDINIRNKEVSFDNLDVLCQTLRRVSSRPIILGGSGFSIFPAPLLELVGADFGVRGEGEVPLVALINALENGGRYDSIPGLVYREGNQIRLNPPQAAPFGEALSEADYPQRLVDYYLEKTGMLNLQTQRGCAWACCYCTYPLIEGKINRRRPPELVAEELAQLQNRGARYVYIVDSIFNSANDHVWETCEAILKRNLQIKWGCFLRPQGLSPELMRIMTRAGLAHIEFGSDSFCDVVLTEYGKNFSFGDILQSSELAQQERVDYCHYLICGGPGETPQTLQTAFQNSQQLKEAAILAVVGMRIYPGTRLWQRAVSEGCIGPETDLLQPIYYLAPGLSGEEVFDQLQQFTRVSPSWIVGDPTEAYARAVQRLRKRGVVGPLWSYFAAMQRFLPQIPV
jgi:radical SAM superfamily enzyme YgiQ (UPF0313 family)